MLEDEAVAIVAASYVEVQRNQPTPTIARVIGHVQKKNAKQYNDIMMLFDPHHRTKRAGKIQSIFEERGYTIERTGKKKQTVIIVGHRDGGGGPPTVVPVARETTVAVTAAASAGSSSRTGVAPLPLPPMPTEPLTCQMAALAHERFQLVLADDPNGDNGNNGKGNGKGNQHDQVGIDDPLELDALLSLFPPAIRDGARLLATATRGVTVVDVVLDVGRRPSAVARVGSVRLAKVTIPGAAQVFSREDLASVLRNLSSATGRPVEKLFAGSGRVGIDRTLHRVSRVVCDPDGTVGGLTCRVGRSIRSSLAIVRDVADRLAQDYSASLLLVGSPGAGKTTLLRAIASEIAKTRNVVIVDPDGEIAGNGIVPHASIGDARRVRVATDSKLGDAMLEAVKNHTPDTVVIDEIGGAGEVAAAKSIAQRGVSLVASAHGQCLADILREPALRMLLGGVGTAVVGDTAQMARGLARKTTLERPHPSHFTMLIEVVRVGEVVIHHSVNEAVDDLLAGQLPHADHRSRDPDTGCVSSVFRQISESNKF